MGGCDHDLYYGLLAFVGLYTSNLFTGLPNKKKYTHQRTLHDD